MPKCVYYFCTHFLKMGNSQGEVDGDKHQSAGKQWLWHNTAPSDCIACGGLNNSNCLINIDSIKLCVCFTGAATIKEPVIGQLLSLCPGKTRLKGQISPVTSQLPTIRRHERPTERIFDYGCQQFPKSV